MDNKNLLKVHNKTNKRRSYLAVDPNEYIADLLENKINENKLINDCISGIIPEKARPLVWAILLNIIPLNKPHEWTIYFEQIKELYKNKIDEYLKIKEINQEDEYDYEAIDKNLRIVNKENIQKSNFTNVNTNSSVKISNITKNNNLSPNKTCSNDYNNSTQREFINEKIESEENKKFNIISHNNLITTTEKIELINLKSKSNNNDLSVFHEKKDETVLMNKVSVTEFNRNKLGSEASKEDSPIFELIVKKPKTDKFYLFYTENEKVSLQKISEENSEISEASHIIKLDVERTFQEMDLFKTLETKEILCKTLFIWYRENADLGYKQGMNEILATIFYAAFNIDEPIFEKISNNENNEKENKHKKFINLIESEDFFQVILYALFDQLFALGLKSIYNYHNLIETKEFSYIEEKSNFDLIKNEINELIKNIENNHRAHKIINNHEINNKVITKKENKISNEILENNDFEKINKLDKIEKMEKPKFFNLENLSSFLVNKKENAKNNINDSFKSLKQFILKRPWEYKKSTNKKTNKYKQEEKNKNTKIDYKIFESDNMDRLKLEEILNLEQSDLRRRVNIIFFYYLKSFDAELYNHLLHKIDPYIIIFRWILCLFNREISLKYVIYIWDCIFAVEFLERNSVAFGKSFKNKPYRNVINNFNFVNFICVSIFEDMRKELLQEDEACFVLQMLMHFPNEKNVKEIVKRALKIRKFIYDKLQIKNELVFIE